ncbi:MAG: TonB-dependent receptor [Cytophagales bacterium]|nr:TonB-dependent receptor [Bernardetiaceae bacterium]MDW8211202.1 TonB-dependent receptor [Cytophagales bacterium]
MKMITTLSRQLFCVLGSLLLALQAIAQTTVSGKVTDAVTKEALAGVNIKVKDRVVGTITDNKGNFTLKVNSAPPFTLQISIVGYQSKEVEVTSEGMNLEIALEEQTIIGQEVVVSASRVEESVLKSPVTVERMDIKQIRETPAANFYDALQNLKGVEMSTQSLTFRSFNTRGFNANGNVRVVQLIDGMDNQAPGLNFPVGNIVGISELDLETLELLPGAASALYGPNAINGILLMNSKSPFQYQGASAYVRAGLMNEKNRRKPGTVDDPLGATGMIDAAIRYAKSFNDKVAFKINVGFLQANDWQATDIRDQSLLNGFTAQTGNRTNNPGYNGVNVYGDENSVNMFTSLFANGQPGTGAGGTSAFLGAIASFRYPTGLPGIGGASLTQLTGQTAQQIFQAIIPNVFVSRTGYNERDLADYTTKSIKFNSAVHYRLNEKIEAILQANVGTGTTVYTGADRYSLSNFILSQYKAELRGSNFYLRAYTTQENSGQSYAIGTLANGINEAWKPSTTWFPQYFGAFAERALTTYATAFAGALGQGLSQSAAVAAAAAAAQAGFATFHQQARAIADQGRFLPGSAEFDRASEAVRSRPIPGNLSRGEVGAKFKDRTSLYHFEGMYNLSNQIKFAEIILGANYRVYALNSEGTLFARRDDGSEFNINEFGGFVQASKKLFEDRLKLTGSVRYDKNQNFKGQVNPRASAVLTVAKDHNFRASYQTGFRIPTTQNQYIDLLTPQARLLGGLPLFRERYNMINNPVYTLRSVQEYGAALQRGVPEPQARQLLQVFQFREWKPERIRSFEIGYKSLIKNKLSIDAYYYRSALLNFDGGMIVVQSRDPLPAGAPPLTLLSANTRNVYSFPINSEEVLTSHGWGIGIDYALPKGFTVGGNVSYNDLLNTNKLPAGFETFFNTPRYRYNLSLSNRNWIKNVSFSVNYRWQDEFVWQSSFVGPNIRAAGQSIVPAYSTLDAQVSLKVPSIKSIIKLGGSNLLNRSFTQAWGNPSVGAIYYLQVTFDEFLN